MTSYNVHQMLTSESACEVILPTQLSSRLGHEDYASLSLL